MVGGMNLALLEKEYRGSGLLVLVISVLLLQGCLDDNLTAQYLDIKMKGVFALSQSDINYDDSEVRVEPISQTYTLKDVILIDEQGVEYDLFTDEAEEYRISNRKQRIFRKQLDNSFLNVVFSEARVTFSNQIKGVSKFKTNHSIEISADAGDDYVVTYSKNFSISAGQRLILNIDIKWKKTVLRQGGNGKFTETMDSPGLTVDLQKS